jgi:hypothetical protein
MRMRQPDSSDPDQYDVGQDVLQFLQIGRATTSLRELCARCRPTVLLGAKTVIDARPFMWISSFRLDLPGIRT